MAISACTQLHYCDGIIKIIHPQNDCVIVRQIHNGFSIMSIHKVHPVLSSIYKLDVMSSDVIILQATVCTILNAQSWH